MALRIPLALLSAISLLAPFSWVRADGTCIGPCLSQLPGQPVINNPATEVFTSKKWTHCPVEDEFTQFFPKGEKQSSFVLGGVTLTGTPEQVRVARLLLQGRIPKAWQPAAANCTSVTCAFTNLVGNEIAAKRLFVVAKRDGYIFSFDQNLNRSLGAPTEQIWKPAEIAAIDDGIRALPKQFKNLKMLSSFHRVADGYRTREFRGDRTAAAGSYSFNEPGQGYIVFFDPGFRKGQPSSKFAIHEVCHHYDYQSPTGVLLSEMPGGFREVGWKLGTNNQWTPINEQFINRGAREMPAEDFSESCAAYVTDAAHLKRIAPAKYEYLKKYVFSGQEYLQKGPDLSSKCSE